jgi:hypothetical protein
MGRICLPGPILHSAISVASRWRTSHTKREEVGPDVGYSLDSVRVGRRETSNRSAPRSPPQIDTPDPPYDVGARGSRRRCAGRRRSCCWRDR